MFSELSGRSVYALIQNYTIINFQQKVPPIRLFPPILLLSPISLLIFNDFSHLYFHSEPSSIRNSRVVIYQLCSSVQLRVLEPAGFSTN